MGILEVLLGQIPEAIYFAIFMIIAKGLKEKRLLYILIITFEYVALKRFITFNVGFQISYTFMTYVTLKVLYRDKALITDIFVFMLASILLILTSFISYMIVCFTLNNFYVGVALSRILMIIVLILCNKKLPKLYCKYKSYWNRRKDKPVKIRSLTLRNISIILFNLMFYLINLGLALGLFYFKAR